MQSLPLLNKLQRIPERRMREARLLEILTQRDPENGLVLLSDIVTLCLIGQPPGEDSMLALIQCLHSLPDSDEGFETVRTLYEASQPDSVERFLLLDPPPFRRIPVTKKMGGPRWERDVSLGEKKTFARGTNRIYLDRLLYEAEPSVIKRLCANPALREEDILTIVTRRPTHAAILNEVAFSRWLTRYGVRHALVLNPYAQTSLVLRLLPLLHEQHLKAVQFVGDLHPLVRASCAALVQRRERYLQGEL